MTQTHPEQRIKNLLRLVAQQNASDLHLTVGRYPTLRIDGKLIPLTKEEILTPADTQALGSVILNEQNKKKLIAEGQVDFSYNLEDKVRFRINAFFQQGRLSIAFRMIPKEIRNLKELNLPEILYDFANHAQGLVLLVGPVGHGKSTTLAALINYINHNQEKNIVTIEDPIEYVYEQDKCIISQREVYQDTQSFNLALKAVFREDANVILVGEMRDLETISAALTIAETGHLVFGTLHTPDAVQAINRIIDVFPAHQQQQVRAQISFVLQAVIAQQLLQRAYSSGRCLAAEILIVNAAVRNLIREEKVHQIYSIMQTGTEYGMRTMNQSLAELYQKQLVTYNEIFARTTDPKDLQRLVTAKGI